MKYKYFNSHLFFATQGAQGPIAGILMYLRTRIHYHSFGWSSESLEQRWKTTKGPYPGRATLSKAG
jgi:hypothetical protein